MNMADPRIWPIQRYGRSMDRQDGSMDQLKRLYEKLNWKQRIGLLVAAAAVAVGIAALTHWNQERDFKPLFTGLAPEDAGALVTKLKENGIDYRLGDSGASILVPSARVAEARLSMASAGLPKSGRIGFELFDKTNFGASDFTEQVNYQRAVEGELERTIMSIREVEQARVHITMAKESIYTESRQPAKASVLVKLRPGSRLSPQTVAAICQLTASAVPDLSVDQVSLVDTDGALLNRPRRGASGSDSEASEAALEYRKSVERDLQNKIAATLEPLLGADHFRAGVFADVDITSADQSEEIYDPQKAALVSSQKTEDGPAIAAASGVPGTASNLPRSTSAPATGSSNYARRTENVSYQTSRIVRHTRLPQGSIKKISLSVLVDHDVRFQAGKRIVVPPPAEKLKVIRDLVAAAVGVNAERGDQLVVESFPFESTLAAETLTPVAPAPVSPRSAIPLPQWLQSLMAAKNFRIIAGIGAAAVLALAAGAGVMFARSRRKKKTASVETAAAVEAAARKEIAGASAEELKRQMETQMAEQAALQAKKEVEELMKLKIPAVSTRKTEVLTKHIAAEAKKDAAVMAQVVRSWLNG
jgi:flagellar M-ring protein FliF